MAARKPTRHRHGIDMTPMVDLGFLLVTFFMMMTQFTPPDPVKVSIPFSTAESKLPDTNLITILVSKEGAVYFMMEGKRKLKALALSANAGWGLGLTGNDIEKFSNLAGVGIPASDLKEFLRASESERKNITMPGIPVEAEHNELSGWINYARESNPRARVVIKGDRQAPYPVIRKVMDTLQGLDINRFSLITDTEKAGEE